MDSDSDKRTPDSGINQLAVDYELGTSEAVNGELVTPNVPGLDSVFVEQAALVNHAVQVIGMGKYQWGLFILAGYGWMCDQVESSIPQGSNLSPETNFDSQM
jgi:hypothetical protein